MEERLAINPHQLCMINLQEYGIPIPKEVADDMIYLMCGAEHSAWAKMATDGCSRCRCDQIMIEMMIMMMLNIIIVISDGPSAANHACSTYTYI